MSPVKEEMSEEATTLLNEATGRSPKTSPRASPKASPEAALPTVPPVAPSAGPISLEVNVEAQGVVCAVNAVKAAPAEEVAAPVAATVEPTEAQRAVASAMALNRAMLPANARVKSFNFDINGLVGFDMQNATIGVVGDSAAAAASIKYFGAFAKASGTGCVLRACPAALASYPPVPVPSRRREASGKPVVDGVEAVELPDLCARADIVVVHGAAAGFITADFIGALRPSAMLLAPSALIDLDAATNALESKHLGYLGCLDAPKDVPAALAARLVALPNALVPEIGGGAAGGASPASQATPSLEPVVVGDAADGAKRVAFFSSRGYFTERFAAKCSEENTSLHFAMRKLRFEMHAAALSPATAELAKGCRAVCLFVNDECDASILETLSRGGVELILMRCAGFDKVDLKAAAALGIKVVRVPAYSPEAVAQMAVALLFTLTWQLAAPAPTAAKLGLDCKNTTVGVLGTGRIGYLYAMMMQGFGCNVVAYDPFKNKAIEAAGIPYLTLEEVYAQADVISLHVPLLPSTKHMINAEALAQMRPGVTLLNVSRGALIDTAAVADALESGKLSAYGADVYEGEAAYFFDDHSGEEIADKLLERLVGLPNAQITGHQAFLTEEALTQIVGTTMMNLGQFLEGMELTNEVKPPPA